MFFKKTLPIVFVFISLCSSLIYAAEPIELLPPNKVMGMPLMMALNERKSMRTFSKREIPLEVISNLLWAASGVNRDNGRMTAPTAGDSREIDIYVAMEKGLHLYDIKNHILKLVLNEDIRKITGKQDFTQAAPINLIFVANYDRIPYGEDNALYVAADTGYISQNVYLFCASEGLATVALGWVDRPTLEKKLNLNKNQKVILTQPVGFPK